jgi:hypothetical protein
VSSASFATNNALVLVDIFEVSGLASSSVVDKQVSADSSSSSTTWSSGATATTTQASEIFFGVVGAYRASSLTIAATASGYTNETKLTGTIGSTQIAQISGFDIVSATGTTTYSGTCTSSAAYVACAVTLFGSTVDNGTGGVNVKKPRLSGSGFVPVTASGGVHVKKPALAGSGVAAPTGSGGVRVKKPRLSGSGSFTVNITGSGGIHVKKPALHGSGFAPVSGTGSTAVKKPRLSGAGSFIGAITGSGGVRVKKPALHGSGFAAVTGSGGVKVHKPALHGAGIGPAINLMNVWDIRSAPSTGVDSTAVANTNGNTLVAFLVAGQTTSEIPVFNVADDGHNLWRFGGRETFADGELEIWIAANARPATVVSAGSTWPTQGVCGMIAEFTGMPDFVQVVLTATAHTSHGSNLTVSGTASQACQAFTVFAISQTGGAPVATTPSGWLAGSNNNTGSFLADPSSQSLWFAYGSFAAGTVSAAWHSSLSAELTALTVGFSTAPPVPAQPNPNWPALTVEAAFGYQPGAINQIPSWTDITSRCIIEDQATGINASRGREYELTQADAGELSIMVNNLDGAFNPENTGSPFWPHVTLETPVRVSAVWQNITYPVGFGYISSLPQEFPDPQWGFVEVKASDGVSILSNARLPSALGGEYLADGAYAYIPCSEFFTTANGEPLGNASRVNTKPAYGYDGAGPLNLLQSGQTLNLAGDPGSGIGISSLTTMTGPNLTALGARLPGIRYLDYAIPQPVTTGATLECIAITPTGPHDPSAQAWFQLMALEAPANNYVSLRTPATDVYPQHNARMALVISNQATTAKSYSLLMQDYWQPYAEQDGVATVNYNDGKPHLHTLTLSYAATSWTMRYFIDGVFQSSFTTSPGSVEGFTDLNAISLGGPPGPGGVQAPDGWNYSAGQLAYFGQVLPDYRIQAHATAALTAWNADTVSQRFGRILAWGGIPVPRAGTMGSATPLMGNADQIQGQSVSDALNDLATNDGGMPYCAADGANWYKSRMSFYNRPPKFIFGDNAAGGEIGYDPNASFGFDNSFLYNLTESQRTVSAGTELIIFDTGAATEGINNYGAVALEADFPSEAEYFARGPLSQGVETTSDQDAYDRASWSLTKYRQPQIRANEIVIEPSSNPAFWPAALGVEQGDIVTVNRRPIAAPAYSVNCVVQKVTHQIGPGRWRTKLNLSPYFPEDNVLQLDTGGFDSVASGAIGW